MSTRLPPHVETNSISRAVAACRASGRPLIDLTESNPTRVGLRYPEHLLDALSSPAALDYEPHALGWPTAREAVARDYARRGVRVDPAHVVLSSSTSEAYSWIFKLLCDPGQAVLVPQPSYPLFEHLTRLEAVRAVPYRLHYHGRWEIDGDSLRAAPDDVKALLLVSPNNPTGSYVSPAEAAQVAVVARERGWAIVSDEVFAEYALDARAPATEVARGRDVLSFTLGGASKSLGLPQVKLAWMIVDGPPLARDRALAALEFIADTFLSVGTPVQVAIGSLLESGAAVREQIQQRVAVNLATARRLAAGHPACSLLGVEGGWSLVVRVPAVKSEETLVLDLVEHEGVLVHPGYFFDFPHEAFVVVSLLPAEAVFEAAFERVLV